MTLQPIGTDVIVSGCDLPGTIVGYGQKPAEDPTIYYLVEMDEGFWSDDHDVFVTTVVVHPDNINDV